jgi:hypothetical protein
MTGGFQQTTVAATETPSLHESVNAVPGPRKACISAAKVGNATLVQAQREAEHFVRNFVSRSFRLSGKARLLAGISKPAFTVGMAYLDPEAFA